MKEEKNRKKAETNGAVTKLKVAKANAAEAARVADKKLKKAQEEH